MKHGDLLYNFAKEECIREDILRELLEKEKVKAMAMSIYEYNQEEHMRMELKQLRQKLCVSSGEKINIE